MPLILRRRWRKHGNYIRPNEMTKAFDQRDKFKGLFYMLGFFREKDGYFLPFFIPLSRSSRRVAISDSDRLSASI